MSLVVKRIDQMFSKTDTFFTVSAEYGTLKEQWVQGFIWGGFQKVVKTGMLQHLYMWYDIFFWLNNLL